MAYSFNPCGLLLVILLLPTLTVSSHAKNHSAAHMHNPLLWGVQVQQAELTLHNTQQGFASEGMAWYGTDADRAILDWQFEGGSGLENAEIALLWRQPLSGFWNLDLGAVAEYAHNQTERSWLQANINGVAPYWVELNMALWLGDKGRSALKFEAEYDVRISQRVVLQPKLGFTAYGKSDDELGRGAGLAEVETGLRLRYEVSRQFVPYVGFSQTRSLGKSAQIQRDAGEASAERQVVLGVSAMF